MNKLFSKIASLSVGLAMAAGVGLALGQQRVERVEAADETFNVTYTISSYEAGSQYAEDESHVLDSYLTLITNQCHFTSELRVYNDGAASGSVTHASVRFNSKLAISALTINANCNKSSKTTSLKLSGSTNGGTSWDVVDTKTTGSGTSYGNITFAFGGNSYKTLLIENTGSYQSRIKTMTVTYVKEAVVVDSVTVKGPNNEVGSMTINSGYLGLKNIQLKKEFVYSSGAGTEAVTWTSSSESNTVSANGVVHITKNENTTITATSVEDTSKSSSITLNISDLIDEEFIESNVTVNTATFGESTIKATGEEPTKEFTAGNVNITVSKSTSSSDPGYYTSNPISFRIYQDAQVTLSTVDGSAIYFVELYANACTMGITPALADIENAVLETSASGGYLINLSAVPVASLTIHSKAQFRFDALTIYSKAVSASEVVDAFVTNYMHPEISYENNEDTGACRGETGYFNVAKTAFNALSDEARELFMTDAAYANPKARLLAWARANNSEINESNLIVEISVLNPIFTLQTQNIGYVIVISIVAVSAISFGLFFMLRKRKEK